MTFKSYINESMDDLDKFKHYFANVVKLYGSGTHGYLRGSISNPQSFIAIMTQKFHLIPVFEIEKDLYSKDILVSENGQIGLYFNRAQIQGSYGFIYLGTRKNKIKEVIEALKKERILSSHRVDLFPWELKKWQKKDKWNKMPWEE